MCKIDFVQFLSMLVIVIISTYINLSIVNKLNEKKCKEYTFLKCTKLKYHLLNMA